MPKFRLIIDSYKIPEGFIPVAYRPPLTGEYVLTSELEALKFANDSTYCFIILKEVVQPPCAGICKQPAKLRCTIDIPVKQKGFSNHAYELIDLRTPKDGDIIMLSNGTIWTTTCLLSIYPIFKRRMKEKEES